MATTDVCSADAAAPVLALRFIVSWGPPGGAMTPAARVAKIAALTRTSEAAAFREGRAPRGAREAPGQTTPGELTLERGLMLDNDFVDWANRIWSFPDSKAGGAEPSLDFRRDVKLDLLKQAGQIVATYHVFNCWPSACTMIPEPDASTTAVALESLTLQHEGWSRDGSVKAPSAVS